MTVSQITGSSGGILLTAASYSNPVTVTATGNVSGSTYGIEATSAWTLVNAGKISGATIIGVDLLGGGSVTNQAGGSITGLNAGLNLAAAGTVVNAGSITGSNQAGVVLKAGGLVSNAATGTIWSNGTGLLIEGGQGTVTNAGTIRGLRHNALYLGAGGSVSNVSGGTISGYYAVRIAGGAGSVYNSGSIAGTPLGLHGSDGIALRAGGSVVNAASGTITGTYNGVLLMGLASVQNSGHIAGGSRAGVALTNGGLVTNLAGGAISGYYGVSFSGSAGTFENAGTVTAKTGSGVGLKSGGLVSNAAAGLISGHVGVLVGAAAGTIDNYGSITASNGAGVGLGAGGVVTNAAGGQIVGSTGVSLTSTASSPASLDNAGKITGSKSSGVYLGGGGTIVNEGSGLVSGPIGILTNHGAATVDNLGSVTASGLFGVYLAAGGSLVNGPAALITGATGVNIVGGAGTVANAGTISATGDGIKLTAGNVSNAASGLISGAIGLYLSGSSATFENAGRISGTTASVELNGTTANRLIVDAGASFAGKAIAKAGSANTLELTAKTGSGILGGFGSKYQNFHNIVIDSGAKWGVSGTSAGFAGTTITGLAAVDFIDLTDLTFAVGETASLNSATDVLTIASSKGAVLDTLQLAGNESGLTFVVSSDGSTGTAIGTSQSVVSPISQVTGASGGIVLAALAYTNPVTVIAAATVTNLAAGGNGMSAASSWTVLNAGAVSATNDGILLAAGGSISNAALGSISGSYGISIGGGTGTVTNSGNISGGNDGILLTSGGTVTNTGSIGGKYGIVASGASATVENAGMIGGTTGAVMLNAATSNRLIVDGGAVFTGNVFTGNSAKNATNTLELTANDGAGTLNGLGGKYVGFPNVTIDSGAAWDIVGSVKGFAGITLSGLTASDQLDLTDLAFAAGETASVGKFNLLQIHNSANVVIEAIQLNKNETISSLTATVTSDGHGGTDLSLNPPPVAISQITRAVGAVVLVPVKFANPITVTASGTISNPTSGGNGLSAASSWTVQNAGAISGAKDGILLSAGGSVTNAATGSVGGTYGIYLTGASGAVANSGAITGTGDAILLKAGGYVTNAGSIAGSGDGIHLSSGGSVANAASGSISGSYGIYSKGFTATVENAGTISGTKDAVVFNNSSGSRLIVDGGAVFNGAVTAANSSKILINTLELSARTGSGALNGLGSKYLGFQSVVFDAGATWSLGGAVKGFAGTTLSGFAAGDRLDVTDLAFATGETATVGLFNVLQIRNSARTVIESIQLNKTENLAAATFTVKNDGSGGTAVVFNSPAHAAAIAAGSASPSVAPASQLQRQEALLAEAMAAHSAVSSGTGPLHLAEQSHDALSGAIALSHSR